MDSRAVEEALALDEAWIDAARASWRALMELAVWGELKASSPAALQSVRRRALEVGERLRSMFADRDWIPHPRERLKNALASLLGLRQGLADLDRALGRLDECKDVAELRKRHAELCEIAGRLAPASARWASLLESQYHDAAD